MPLTFAEIHWADGWVFTYNVEGETLATGRTERRLDAQDRDEAIAEAARFLNIPPDVITVREADDDGAQWGQPRITP